MKNILVIGSTGQIGSELIPELRIRYGQNHVIAGIHNSIPSKEFFCAGPVEVIDIIQIDQIAGAVKRHKIDTIFNLAAFLSVVAESNPLEAWRVGVDGLLNVLEVAKQYGCSVCTPSTIGVFGPLTPLDNTPQDTLQRPQTVYGISKVADELLSDYYYKKYGVDTRSVRLPGVISNVALPGGGTTDYAVEIYYAAVKDEHYTCPLRAGTFLDMIYMPDTLEAMIRLMEADPSGWKHRNAFNLASMSLEPEMIAAEIGKHIPSFKMDYKIDPIKQGIAESWPNKMDDTCAREEWGWKPQYDLAMVTVDMLRAIREKQQTGFL